MRRLRVLRPIQSIEEVQASLDTFGDRIVEKLDGPDPSVPSGGDAPGDAFSYQGVFDKLGSDLESLRVRVVGAEDEHIRRQALASAIGRRVEEIGTALYDQQVAARRVLGGAFTPDRGFELAAISGITPRTFKPLEEQVDLTVKLLREPVVDQPSVRVPGVTVDLDGVAGGLETLLLAFRAKRAELERARKASGESKVLLDEALKVFQGTFPWIAQVLEGFAKMAGERALAERIRTSIRRVTRRQAEGDGEGSGDTEPDSTPDGEASNGEASSEPAEPSTAPPDETESPDGETSEPAATPDATPAASIAS